MGNGSDVPSTAPVIVLGMSNVFFYTSGYCCAAFKTDGSLWGWGNSHNSYSGSVGSGLTGTPQMIISGGVYYADAGQDLVSFVKNDGTVWGIGNNAN